MSLRDPLARARGLGAAGSGSHHWTMQRLTAIALLFTTPWFLGVLVGVAGADIAAAREVIAQPWNAVLMLVFVGALFWHAQLGLQVVIEDYVHLPWLETTLQLLVRFACLLGALLALIAVGRIAFGA